MVAKTKQKKTLDELLEEALVPEEEQPYEVPENWVWVRLGSYFAHINNQVDPFGDENYIGLEHMTKGGGIHEVGQSEGLKSKKTRFKSGDVLYGKLRPYLNKHAVVNFAGLASTDILVYRSDHLSSNYLLDKYLGLPNVIQFANQNSKGINLPRVAPKVINELPFPLPPLSEQKRISVKVERLLNKIEQAKQLIEEAKETFEKRRATILDRAFRGELTKKWREERNDKETTQVFLRNKLRNYSSVNKPYVLPKSWIWVNLGSVCEKITDGTHKSPKSYPIGQYKYISAKNIKLEGIDLSNVTYINEDVHRQIYERCDVKKRDVLYIKDGATTGIATINNLEEEFSLLSSVGLLRPIKSLLSPEYLMHCLNSPNIKRLMLGMMSGNAIRRLTLKKIKNGIIPLPPLKEQEKIVSILNVIKLDSKLKGILELERHLELLKSTILYKAFRGNLGTNDPNEENALELLKKVLKIKHEA